jgi:hypothetical protein
MQDGHRLNVTDNELSMARSASDFRGGEEALSYAHLCYAAMAKRALKEGHEGSRNYNDALRAVNNGENPYDTARFLGLKDNTIDVRPDSLSGQDSVVAWSRSHCVFVNRDQDGSHTSDHYGRAHRFNQTDTNGWGLKGAFTFRARTNEGAGRGAWGG